ncbi:MAG: cupin domain-containing protein [Clostridia bacterium]|nr:cupin domain-containing protein [Clostridia bacterium]
MDIGSELKRLRQMNGLTQQELADRAELTKGYISQLEGNLTSPAISTLTTLLQCLGSDLSEFFSKETDNQIVFTVSDMVTKEDEHLKNAMTWLVPNSQKNDMEPVMLELEISGQTEIDEPHTGEEFGYVLDGSIKVVLAEKEYKVKKGQSFYYQADEPHYILNDGKKKAKLLWVSSPPFF